MAKLIKTDESIREEIDSIITNKAKLLVEMGIPMHYMSTKKAKDIIKITKASPATEFMASQNKIGDSVLDGMLLICVYEEAWDRLGEDNKEMIVELALNGVEYDTEKDKLNVTNDNLRNAFQLCQKYGAEKTMNALEASYLVIQQIDDEERERKEAQKLAKGKKNA